MNNSQNWNAVGEQMKSALSDAFLRLSLPLYVNSSGFFLLLFSLEMLFPLCNPKSFPKINILH